MTATFFATVGTSEHPFTRLVDWLDHWLERTGDAHGVIQHGPSAVPRSATGHAMISPDDMATRIGDALVVVTHGGPGSIMAARTGGHIPIVVPRTAQLREHIDDHQVLFSRALAATGQIHLAESEAELHRHLDLARRDVTDYRHDVSPDRTVPAADAMRTILDSLTASRAGFVSIRRAGHVVNYFRRQRRRY